VKEHHPMSNLARWVPRLIAATGIIHLAYGLVVPSMRASLGEIAGAGGFNAVEGHPRRESWFWFMLSGVALLAVGELARWGVRETGRLPRRLGGWLLAIAAPLIVTMPTSGGWLVAAVGAVALRAARTNGQPQPSASERCAPRETRI
jgi:hypothetical protein